MKYTILSILLSLSTYSYAEEQLTINSPQLQYSIATSAVLAAVKECTKRGYKVSAAISGRDGNLIAFTRHPLAGPHTIETSQKKAYTSASLQTSTGKQLQKTRPDLNFAPGIVLIQGSLPINIAGHFYGGIAVAGADTKIDEKCAKHGLDVITSALEFGA
ncbi:MAG: heme-binding protein [Gammaproteobacteria bacterium]|nr:heme-binding protein [Gammaproteobacteria bacterium]